MLTPSRQSMAFDACSTLFAMLMLLVVLRRLSRLVRREQSEWLVRDWEGLDSALK